MASSSNVPQYCLIRDRMLWGDSLVRKWLIWSLGSWLIGVAMFAIDGSRRL